MSILGNLTILAGAEVLQDVLLRQGRSIAGIIPNVTIDESHVDDMTVTSHPVEQGAAITDHAFKNPSQVTMRCGFGQSGTALSLNGGGADPKAMYQQLLDLQASRIPFDVVTGKRRYQNMLITSISVGTDAASESVLMVTVTMREVIVVETRVATIPPQEVHKFPESTAPIVDGGVRQLVPADGVSILKRMATVGAK